MNILITGHRGYIGRHVHASFNGTPGVKVYGMERVLSHDMFETMETKMNAFDIDTVIHCGGIRDSNWDHPEIFFFNTQCTNRLAQLCHYHEAKLVFLSSSLAKDPDSFYGFSKRLSEDYINNFSVDACILRLCNVWGLEQNVFHALWSVPTKILTHTLYHVFDIERDYIHVTDVVNAIHLAIAHKGTYDVGTGETQSPMELCNYVDYTGAKVANPEDILERDIPKRLVAEHMLTGFNPTPFIERWEEERDAIKLRHAS